MLNKFLTCGAVALYSLINFLANAFTFSGSIGSIPTLMFVLPVKTFVNISSPVTGSGILACLGRGNVLETSSKDPTPFLNPYPVLGSIATSATSSNIGIIRPPLPLPDVKRSFNSNIILFCILGSAILLPAILLYFLATSLVVPSITSLKPTACNKSESISPRLALSIKN